MSALHTNQRHSLIVVSVTVSAVGAHTKTFEEGDVTVRVSALGAQTFSVEFVLSVIVTVLAGSVIVQLRPLQAEIV